MKDLFESVDQFISSRFSRDDAVLRSIDPSLRKAGISNISVSSSQGKLLHLLVLLCRARRILEIGTLAGYSTIWMARALPKGGRLVSIEYNPDHARIAARHISRAGLADRVELRIGTALEVLPALHGKGQAPFDMVFIDADKAPFEQYFTWSLKLTHPGSLIVADNVIRQGRILRPHSRDAAVRGAQRFLKALASSKKVSATVLQTVGPKGHDGIAVAIVK
jgi:caffeoyl-CoA O-methyltransferase